MNYACHKEAREDHYLQAKATVGKCDNKGDIGDKR